MLVGILCISMFVISRGDFGGVWLCTVLEFWRLFREF